MKPSTPLSASPSKGKLSSTKQAPSTKKVGGHCPRSSWSSWLTLYWRTEEACHPLWRKLEEWHYISSSLIVNMDGTHLVGPFPCLMVELMARSNSLSLSHIVSFGASLQLLTQQSPYHTAGGCHSLPVIVRMCCLSVFPPLMAATFTPPQWLSKASLSICQSQPIISFPLATEFIELPFSLKSLVRPTSSSCIRISM